MDFEGIRAVSPFREMGVYEAAWQMRGATRKTVFESAWSLRQGSPTVPLPDDTIEVCTSKVVGIMKAENIEDWGLRVLGTFDYPSNLADDDYPATVLYFQGNWNLAFSPAVAIVGTRNPTDEGIARAKKVARLLVEDGYTVASGLAKGIDTAALTSAIENGGHVIAVIGTPITDVYPKENKALQRQIAADHLLVSHVPVLRYRSQGPSQNRYFFPERNILMSAVSLATVIVEASETSGTLVQARAALKQGRKLFLMDNLFHKGLSWPEKFVEKGAIRVRDYSDIRSKLPSPVEEPAFAV